MIHHCFKASEECNAAIVEFQLLLFPQTLPQTHKALCHKRNTAPIVTIECVVNSIVGSAQNRWAWLHGSVQLEVPLSHVLGLPRSDLDLVFRKPSGLVFVTCSHSYFKSASQCVQPRHDRLKRRRAGARWYWRSQCPEMQSWKYRLRLEQTHWLGNATLGRRLFAINDCWPTTSSQVFHVGPLRIMSLTLLLYSILGQIPEPVN